MLSLSAPNKSVTLQDRDISLLRGLFESRIMTAGHTATLYFDGKAEATKKRLYKLKAAGLIGERRRSAFEPALLFLTRKAFTVLRDRGVLADYPHLDSSSLDKRSSVSELTVRHELEVMDVKAAICSSVASTGQFITAEFTTWPLLCQFEVCPSGQRRSQILVKPDGFVRIHERERDGGVSEHTFFLEIDRSTETQETLVARAGYYFDYYKSGGFARRNGAAPTAFKDYPFRVLMVFKTAERRNNTAKRLLESNPPIFTQVYLSTLNEVTARPLDAIWICPQDYREATKGTPFEPGRQREMWRYKRQSLREDLVEKKIRKHCILIEDSAM